MSENENVVNSPAGEVKKDGFAAKFKEWGRKKIVSLKRKPQTIPLVFLLVSSLVYLLSLGNLSQTGMYFQRDWSGFSIFVNTLFSILVLVLYLWTYPKRKKPNYVMLALVFVFIAIMITLDIVFYVQILPRYQYNLTDPTLAADKLAKIVSYTKPALNASIAHIVLLAISAILIATLPIYKKLIIKINTSKVVESTEIKEQLEAMDE